MRERESESEKERETVEVLNCFFVNDPSQTRITVHALHDFDLKRSLKKTFSTTCMHIIELSHGVHLCCHRRLALQCTVYLPYRIYSRYIGTQKSPDIEKELSVMAQNYRTTELRPKF
jgi:hypothetical protein